MVSTDTVRPAPFAPPRVMTSDDGITALAPAPPPATPSAAPSAATPAAATLEGPSDAVAPASRPQTPTPVLVKLLKMADGYAKTGARHLALDLYFTIIDRYSETPEAERARLRLMEIAQQHEKAGETHQARALYERLLYCEI
ncbi:MAG: hypothetical protein NT049_04965 [Planctomycetota bacterium]|nr:hypothetical protein [Planctomycetota bacterium]